mmetsp:Transcript_6088/g.8776  ORF Transcript_6088/g.8776 Transcript_6088/m.8776 type:complete len:313 (-) Transcript_6088:121-1059(-)
MKMMMMMYQMIIAKNRRKKKKLEESGVRKRVVVEVQVGKVVATANADINHQNILLVPKRKKDGEGTNTTTIPTTQTTIVTTVERKGNTTKAKRRSAINVAMTNLDTRVAVEKGKDRTKKKDSTSDSADGGTRVTSSTIGAFGKYGIIKETDFYSKQRDFEAWMTEIKNIPSFTGPKWELMNYFREFAEDYNTATLPHEKFYNYEKWEIEDYERKKAEAAAAGGATGAKSDEWRHMEEMKKKQEEKRKEELDRIRGSMNQDKVAEMKRQQLMKHEMAMAFKTGDQEKVKRLQKRLEPEDVRKAAGGGAHPWAK